MKYLLVLLQVDTCVSIADNSENHLIRYLPRYFEVAVAWGSVLAGAIVDGPGHLQPGGYKQVYELSITTSADQCKHLANR